MAPPSRTGTWAGNGLSKRCRQASVSCDAVDVHIGEPRRSEDIHQLKFSRTPENPGESERGQAMATTDAEQKPPPRPRLRQGCCWRGKSKRTSCERSHRPWGREAPGLSCEHNNNNNGSPSRTRMNVPAANGSSDRALQSPKNKNTVKKQLNRSASRTWLSGLLGHKGCRKQTAAEVRSGIRLGRHTDLFKTENY